MALNRRRPGLVYPVNENWHYVGATDEPAFQNSWANSAGSIKLAFRNRETGVVDIHGTVTGGSTGSIVFTLPSGYRPSSATVIPAVTNSTTAASLTVATNGDVGLAFTAGTKIYISVQVFLTLPSTA